MPLQFTLPRRRKVTKMGVREPEHKVWPRHRRFVKTHECCVPNCAYRNVVIDFAHVKSVGAGGQDWDGISLCRPHHAEQHTIGVKSFGIRYGIDLGAMAAEFARRSPDVAMKEAMRALENV